MAPTVVQTFSFNDVTGTDPLTKSAISTASGNVLILAIGTQGGTLSSITDSGSNTWSQIAETHTTSGSPLVGCSIWATGANAAAITSFTLHTGGIGVLCQFWEVSGIGAADVSATAKPAIGTSGSSGSTATPSTAAGFAAGIIATNQMTETFSSQTFTSGAGTSQTHAGTAFVVGATTTGGLVLANGSPTAQAYSAAWNVVALSAAAVSLFPAVSASLPKQNRFAGQAVARAATR